MIGRFVLQVLYIPLGVFGLNPCGCWPAHRVPATFYRPIAHGYRESLVVVTPVYQEDPDIFREAVLSWLRNDVDEVIAVIDVTDVACERWPAATGIRILLTDVPGKRVVVAGAGRPPRRAFWSPSSIPTRSGPMTWLQESASHSSTQRSAEVGPRHNVLNPIGFWQDIADMYLDYRYFDQLAAQSVIGQCLSCLSGRTAVLPARHPPRSDR